MSNFLEGLIALAKNMRLSFYAFFYNKGVFGFLGGVLLSILVTVFILSKNPRNIPIMLRYTSTDSFQKIAPQDAAGSYTLGFTTFLKLYAQIRILCLFGFISFCIMMTTIVLSRHSP